MESQNTCEGETFLWSAAIGCLPTKDNLRTKRVLVNELCPVCNEALETTLHCLSICSFAKECYFSMGKVLYNYAITLFSDWLRYVYNQYTGSDLQLIVMLCWALWKCRNEIVWNQRGINVAEVVVLAKATLNQWLCAQDKNFNQSIGHMSQKTVHSIGASQSLI